MDASLYSRLGFVWYLIFFCVSECVLEIFFGFHRVEMLAGVLMYLVGALPWPSIEERYRAWNVLYSAT